LQLTLSVQMLSPGTDRPVGSDWQFTEQRRSDSRARTGPGWRQGRALFTYADGRPTRPEYFTHRFHVLVQELDLPPIRLHDLRHGAATIALACPKPPTGPPRPPPT
jgi:integrase